MKPPSALADTVMPLTRAQTTSKPSMDAPVDHSAHPKQMWHDCMKRCGMAKDGPYVETVVLRALVSTKGIGVRVPPGGHKQSAVNFAVEPHSCGFD